MEIPKSVAKISAAKLADLKVREVKDVNDNIVVDLDFGGIMEITEFEAIAYEPTAQSLADSITPPRRHT